MPVTDEEQEEENRRLLSSVDFSALDGLEGATSAITGEPATPTADARARSETSRALDTARMPAGPIIADAPRPSSLQVMAEARGEQWPDTPHSRRHASGVIYPMGELPLSPRAQEIERRLQAGERAQIDRELRDNAERDDFDDPSVADEPRAQAAPAAQPPLGTPRDDFETPIQAGEREAAARAAAEQQALAALADGEPEAPASQPRASSSLARSLGSPTEEFDDVGKPEAIDKGPEEGLIPGEEELSRARTGDVPRRLLHNLANAFRALGGRPANREFVRDEDRVRAQQQRMLGEKRTARREQQSADAQAMTRALQERQLAQRGEQQDFERQMSERNATRQDLLAQGQLARTLEQAESERSDREYDQARRTPGSPESGRARDVMNSLVAALPDEDRRRVTEVFLGPEEEGGPLLIDSLSAEDIDGLRGDLTRYLRNGLSNRSARRGSGGGGGGGIARQGIHRAIVDRMVGPDATPEQRAAAEQEANALISAVGVRRAGQSVMSDVLQTARADDASQRQVDRREAQASQGPELIPGSGIRAGGDLGTNEDARWREGFGASMESMAGFRRMERIAARFGRTGAINPQARAAINPELTLMRSMVAEMGRTGVINPTEVPTINAALPNPADPEQATFETFGARLQQWRNILEDKVRARATVLGVSQPNQRRLVRALRTGSVPPENERRVPIITPDGRRGTVPESQLQAAIERGARRAE